MKMIQILAFFPILIMTMSFMGCSSSKITFEKNEAETPLIGSPLPKIESETLSGRAVTLPDSTRGRITLLIMGFTYRSRFQVEPWGKQFSSDFGKEPDVAFFEMPMMGSGLVNLIKPFADSGMRRGTPEEAHDNVVCVYADNSRLRNMIGVSDPDAAYLLLLDRKGIVRWNFAGALTGPAYADLKQTMDLLRAEG